MRHPSTEMFEQDAEKVRQRRSCIAQWLNVEETFLGRWKHYKGFSVRLRTSASWRAGVGRMRKPINKIQSTRLILNESI